MVEPLATGLMLLREAELTIGDRVVVIGGGPIGLATVLWARFFGARRIVVSEMVSQRLDLALTMGATDVIDVGADPDGHVWEVAHNPFSPLGPNGEAQIGGAA